MIPTFRARTRITSPSRTRPPRRAVELGDAESRSRRLTSVPAESDAAETDRGGPRWLTWPRSRLEPIEDVEFPDDSHATSTGISNAKLGMWVYLASDALLFGGLISTYLIYKNRPGEIPGIAGPARSRSCSTSRSPR